MTLATIDACEPHVINVRGYCDSRGMLGVLDETELPLTVRRVYYLFDVPARGVRGEHGHKRLAQVILCFSGQVEVTLHNGQQKFRFTLNSPSQALYVPPGMWRSLNFVMDGSVVCVLASRPYEVADYIYRFDDFLNWVKAGRPLEEEV